MSYHIGEDESFEVHAEERDGNFIGYIYLGVEIIWTLTEPTSKSPAGIEDFTGMTMRKFARRLAEVLAPTSSEERQ